jgi:hypothetical protein
MITYTWHITEMTSYSAYESCPTCNVEDNELFENVVYNIGWKLIGTDEAYSGYAIGAQSLPVNIDSNFTPYEQLTQAQVLQWVFEQMGEDTINVLKQNISLQIQNQIETGSKKLMLPWETQ